MCRQLFFHHSCEHTTSDERACIIATTSENPFWFKAACPDYEIFQRDVYQLCGKGGYYCSRQENGEKVDKIHAAHTQAFNDIGRIQSHIRSEVLWGQALVTALMSAGNISMEECQKDPRYLVARESLMELREDLAAAKLTETSLLSTIAYWKQWFFANMRHDSGAQMTFAGPSTAAQSSASHPSTTQGSAQQPQPPPNQSGAGPSSSGLTQMPAGQSGIGGYSVGMRAQYSPPNFPSVQYAPPRLPGVLYAQQNFQGIQCTPPLNFQDGRYTRPNFQSGQYTQPTFQGGHYAPQSFQAGQYAPSSVSGAQHIQPTLPAAKTSHNKRSQPWKKSIQEDAFPVKDSPPVRRSGRVRTKKINYAEEDPFSRTPSPAKSDAGDSSFSPSKRDPSVSPDKEDVLSSRGSKAQATRNSGFSNTLVDMISDFKRREAAKAAFLEPIRQALPGYLARLSKGGGSSAPSGSNPEVENWSDDCRPQMPAQLTPQNSQIPASQNEPVQSYEDWKASFSEPLRRAMPDYLANKLAVPQTEATQPEATRNWYVNRYNANPQIPAQNLSAAPQQHWSVNRYDADATIPVQAQREPDPKSVQYDLLQRNFQSERALPLPQTPPQNVEEPKKRRRPAPPSSASKKVKLDVPAYALSYTPEGAAALNMASRNGEKDLLKKDVMQSVEVQRETAALEAYPEVTAQDDDSELSDIDWEVLEKGML